MRSRQFGCASRLRGGGPDREFFALAAVWPLAKRLLPRAALTGNFCARGSSAAPHASAGAALTGNFLRSRQFGCASRLRGGGPDRAGRRSAPIYGRTMTGQEPGGSAASIALAAVWPLAKRLLPRAALTGNFCARGSSAAPHASAGAALTGNFCARGSSAAPHASAGAALTGNFCARGSLAIGQTPLAKGGPDREFLRSRQFGCASRLRGGGPDREFLRSRQFGCASRLRGRGPDREFLRSRQFGCASRLRGRGPDREFFALAAVRLRLTPPRGRP